jgi:hypothetical protein
MPLPVHADSASGSAAHALQAGLPQAKYISFWLYSMLQQPVGPHHLLKRSRMATQLSHATNSSLYDLRFDLAIDDGAEADRPSLQVGAHSRAAG